MSIEIQENQNAEAKNQPSRVDVHPQDLLKRPPAIRPSVPHSAPGVTEKLAEPVFPLRPELLTHGSAASVIGEPHIPPTRRHWSAPLIYRAVRGWMFPYIKSRLLPGEFHPIICYLFTEFKCNLDCHYCWAFDNRVKGMSEDVAKRSIDWLHSTTCRVLALMGGEPLLRPAFAHKVIYYAAKRGFWVYLPTNGRLMRPEVIDRILDAGVATVNLAVDGVNEKPGLPKALNPIRRNFEYLVRKQYAYGATVFFNINICRNNLDDAKALTEIAHDNGIATDYHINEEPMIGQDHFSHLKDNPTFISPDDWPKIDEVLDWLIEKNRSGYKMVNSTARLADMKKFMRGGLQSWDCRAGQNSLIIRVDGSLAPCFPMYSSTCDWGCVGNPSFDRRQLKPIKKTCQPRCFSTLNHNLAFCYNDRRVLKWVGRQALRGFQGLTGSFE
jgi:MoaA/NifB/PqqE/SkfB family radical SAM enzyme